MITVFNGRSRGIGQNSQKDVFIQVSVRLREHLHLFKGARLAVFLTIALHSNEQGWAHPAIELLKSETGYNKDTISRALTDLCQLTIDGNRVLLAAQRRGNKGSFVQNQYLVFPSAEECAKYEDSQELRKARKTSTELQTIDGPCIENQYTVDGLPSSENQYTASASPCIENQYTDKIEVQSVPMPQTSISPSIGLPCPVNPYGSRTILNHNHEESPPPAQPQNDTPIGGGGGGKSKQEPPTETEQFLLDEGFIPTSAYEFRHLDLAAVRRSVKQFRAKGTQEGGMVNHWRRSPPRPAPIVTPVIATPAEKPKDILDPRELTRRMAEGLGAILGKTPPTGEQSV